MNAHTHRPSKYDPTRCATCAAQPDALTMAFDEQIDEAYEFGSPLLDSRSAICDACGARNSTYAVHCSDCRAVLS